MLRKVATISAVTALLVLSGCSTDAGSTAKVTPTIDTPTGSSAKLKQEIADAKDGKGAKEGLTKFQSMGSSSTLTKLDIDTESFQLGARSVKLGSATGDDTPACVDDGIETSETDTSATAKGTITFNNCDIDGIKINGSITVDFSADGSERTSEVTYSASGDMSIISADGQAKIVVSEAKTEGEATITAVSEEGGTSGEHTNATGISAYLEDHGNKFLILNGINTETTAKWNELTHDDSYTFSVTGYIGSDNAGMFEVKTPTTFKGDDAHDCPTEGELTLTDASGDVFSITSDGTNITTQNGTDVDTYPCNNGSEGTE